MKKPFKLKTKIRPEMRPYGTPGRHTLTVQGKLVTWKDNAITAEVVRPGKRGECKGFSKSSRFRMLKMIATIDWEKALPCLFLTLTYPDRCGFQNSKQLTQDRSVFWRYLEAYLGQQVPAVWRTEWKVRQSGENEGHFMPHVHMLIMQCRFISYKWIRWHWRKTLRIWGRPNVQVEACDNSAKSAIYVAKYAGKENDPLLGYGTYLNSTSGRSWGVFRRNLVPMCPITQIDLANTDEASLVRSELMRVVRKPEDTDFSSFTILGDKNLEKARPILDKLQPPPAD